MTKFELFSHFLCNIDLKKEKYTRAVSVTLQDLQKPRQISVLKASRGAYDVTNQKTLSNECAKCKPCILSMTEDRRDIDFGDQEATEFYSSIGM